MQSRGPAWGNGRLEKDSEKESERVETEERDSVLITSLDADDAADDADDADDDLFTFMIVIFTFFLCCSIS